MTGSSRFTRPCQLITPPLAIPRITPGSLWEAGNAAALAMM
jgi:hypothetical protein